MFCLIILLKIFTNKKKSAVNHLVLAGDHFVLAVTVNNCVPDKTKLCKLQDKESKS